MLDWRFRITSGIIPQPFLQRAYFAGWGRIPRLTQTSIQDNELHIISHFGGSGTVHVPMFHEPLGVIMESTETLMNRHEPYCLVKELARGGLGRFYRRLFDWQMLGFQQPDTLAQRVRSLAKRLSGLFIQDHITPEIERDFVSVLDELALIIVDENKEFAEQSLSWRSRNSRRLPVIFGAHMNTSHVETAYAFDVYAKFLQNTFHTVLPMPTWRELEPQPGRFDWDRLERQLQIPSRFGFHVVLGPLLSFNADAFPEWLLSGLSEDGFFESRTSRFVNAVAERYGYLAHGWVLANRFTGQSLPHLSMERTLSMITMLAHQLRSRGITAPIIVGIDQPWGEYALRQSPSWEQVQIAETLMECREIDTFLLEMDFGCGEHQTFPRDPMSVGGMIDQWSFLGKKLYVSFSLPSAGNSIVAESEYPANMQWSEERQRIWTEMLLLTLLSKRSVQGIFWSSLQDSRVPNATTERDYGLVNAQQVFKPAFKHFTAARKKLLH